MSFLQGILKVHVLEARDLHQVGSGGQQDPYCILKLGKETQRTAYKAKSSKTAKWDEVLQFHLQKQKLNIEEGEHEDLLCIEIWDSNVMKDAFISEVYLRLRDLVSTTDSITKWYPMNRQEKKGRLLVDVTPQAQYDGQPDVARKVVWPGHCVAGEIRLCTQYFPPMILKIHKARKLYNATWFSNMHPACSIQVGTDYYATKYVLRGGTEPSWMENFFINPDVRIPRVVKKASESKLTDPDEAPEQYPTSLVTVTVYSAGNITNDFIGKAVVPLSTLLENNGSPMWFQLGRGANASVPAGEIMVTLHQCQPRPQAGLTSAAIFGPSSMNAQSGADAAEKAAAERENSSASTGSGAAFNTSASSEQGLAGTPASAVTASTDTTTSTAPLSPVGSSQNHVLPLLNTASASTSATTVAADTVKTSVLSDDHPSDAASYWKQLAEQKTITEATAPKSDHTHDGPGVSSVADALSQASREEERAQVPGLNGGSATSGTSSDAPSSSTPVMPIRAVSVVTNL